MFGQNKCRLQGKIRQILEWFSVRRDYDKLPAATALLGRKRRLLALANPFYWFTVNIAICQRHLGKGRRRDVEKNWAIGTASDRMKFQDCFSFSLVDRK